MKKVKGKPITGAKPQMHTAPPVKTNANKSSQQAEQQIKQPPMPFANKLGPANIPVTSRLEASNADRATNKMGGTNIGHGALPSGRPVGQTKAINHKGNVFGRFGTSHPKKHRPNDNPKAKKHAAFYGE